MLYHSNNNNNNNNRNIEVRPLDPFDFQFFNQDPHFDALMSEVFRRHGDYGYDDYRRIIANLNDDQKRIYVSFTTQIQRILWMELYLNAN